MKRESDEIDYDLLDEPESKYVPLREKKRQLVIYLIFNQWRTMTYWDSNFFLK